MDITVTVPAMRDGEDVSYSATVDLDTAIQAGAEKIGAQKIGGYWYYVAEEDCDAVYQLTPEELAALGAGEMVGGGADYSLWCSITGVRMTDSELASLRASDLPEARALFGIEEQISERECCGQCGKDTVIVDDENETCECSSCGAINSLFWSNHRHI